MEPNLTLGPSASAAHVQHWLITSFVEVVTQGSGDWGGREGSVGGGRELGIGEVGRDVGEDRGGWEGRGIEK